MTVVYLSEPFPPAPVALDPLEPTIFHEPWWLDIATYGQCRFAEVAEHGQVVGRIPYFMRRKAGLSFSNMPMLTHFLGPAIYDGKGKANNRILKRMEIASELIAKLPPMALFQQKCHRDTTDVVAFQASGFRASVQFTHEIAPQSTDLVWKNMRDKGRNGIRLAREKVSTTESEPEEFVRLYADNIAVRGKTNYLDMQQTVKLLEACVERERGKFFAARGHDGKLICSIFCVWDGSAYYYLMSTRAPDAQRGVASLLIWDAITDAMERGLTFDFDGVASEGAARMAANFTSVISPRYVVTRENLPVKLWRCAESLVKPPNYFCD